MKRSSLLIILLFTFGVIATHSQSFVGKLNQSPSREVNVFTAADTLRILAVMADFQEDKDDATFGNGKFESIYSKDHGSSILDPLPHDKKYFEDHLMFVKNYFAKVSDGQLNISFTILNEIVTVSQTMRNYTPPLDDVNDHTPLAEYAEEVWELADQKHPTIDYSQYDLFFILHAGVGKDISLPTSLGNERDLPSVYLSPKSLQNIFGPEFIGFPVNGGNFHITNSAILPETESREINGFDGITLLELTTNGLIAATVGSYLGLPDLFNTETGRSAIGRFGLMDGQSMFTYAGIFPPEPSAWEKMFLGWVTPVEVSLEDAKINLVNKYIAELGDTSLIKIPINATEYYLIENRKRDALKDGSTVEYISNGQTYSVTFDRDYENYIFYNVDTLKGVILDVDEHDWALPGGDRNSVIETFEDLGIIIWHIDERVIEENYESNTVNNDEYARGVAIVEADGIRDIGETFKTVFGETVVGEGTKEDTWYRKNPAEYYENRFSDDTKPKAESNTNTNSLVTLSDFSEISNVMSFNVSFGSEHIEQIGNFNFGIHNNPSWLSSVHNGNESVLFTNLDNQLIKFNSNGIIHFSNFDEPLFYKPLVLGLDGSEILVLNLSSSLHVHFYNGSSLDSISYMRRGNYVYTSSPVLLSQTENEIEFLIGTSSGLVEKYLVNIASKTISLMEENQAFITPVKQIALLENGFNAISMNEYWSSKFGPSESPLSIGEELLQLVNSINGTDEISVLNTAKSILFISNTNEIAEISESDSAAQFALTDLKNDGNNYIIHNNGLNLHGVNLTGAESNNFPIQDEFASTFTSTPLSVDLNNDNVADVISFTTNGKILAVDGITGKMIDGFPISSGGEVATVPVIFSENGKTALGVITEDNQFMSWNISQYDGKKFWTEENGSASNSSYAAAASSSEAINEFFPQSKAYNWPNPVYDGTTNIRYFVSEDSKAEVTIFDLAGDLVAKLSGSGIGGFDNEIVWDVSGIQSGVYFAHLEVTSNSGKSDTKIIKIAIIK